jgi:DNA-binding beta-propeller fold protein YncE
MTLTASSQPQAAPSEADLTGWRIIRRVVRLALLAGLALIVLLALAGIALLGGAALTANTVVSAPISAQTTQFDGRYLAIASDADMVGTAYADGVLMQVPGAVDTLTLLELPVTDAAVRGVEIPASNAVTSWPQIIALSPDGPTIYVVETSQPVPDDIAQLDTDQFPRGRLVTAIDLSAGPDDPRIQTFEVGDGAIHLAISADGGALAVGMRENERQLAILPTASLDDPESFARFSIDRADGGPASEITSVAWHPSVEFLAVGIDRSELQFYRVIRLPDGGFDLTPHGARLTLGNTITYGQFTGDGAYYLTAEINWNTVPAPLGNLVNPPGEMIAVRFDPSDAAAHAVTSRVAVGLSPEGFAVSPDESLVVTVNMRRTYLPDALAAVTEGADLNSLSLLHFDAATGTLRVLGEEYGFEGVLPEHASFDADGDSLAVAIYNDREDPTGPGAVEFWNVIGEGEDARLERTAVRLPVARGAHAVALIR